MAKTSSNVWVRVGVDPEARLRWLLGFGNLDPVPLTVAQVKHLLAALATPGRPPGHAACWLDWERRHQALARWYHQRTRLARGAVIALAG